MTGSGRAGNDGTIQLHAGCVAWRGRGLLILGPSGSGKSALALQLMAFGCDLVSDDRTDLLRKGDALWASAPAAIAGRVEARGIGILAASYVPSARLALVVDLAQKETGRLPSFRDRDLLGLALPCLHSIESGHFPAAVFQYLKGERLE